MISEVETAGLLVALVYAWHMVASCDWFLLFK